MGYLYRGVGEGLQNIWAQLAPVQATFFSFAKPISLEVLLKPGDFSIDPIWNNPKQPPNAAGGSGGEPASHPTSNRNPYNLPTREQSCPCTSRDGRGAGRKEQPTARAPAEDSSRHTHRGVLALDAGAVEAQGGDAGGAAGDVEDALVVALA